MQTQLWRTSTATAITYLGALLCIVAGVVAAVNGPLWIVLALFVGGSACDALDGRLARTTATTSRFGAWLDMTCDKVGEVALIIGLSWRSTDIVSIRLLLLAAVLGLLSSYAKATAVETRALLSWAEVRIMGRTLRVIVLALIVASLLVTNEAPQPFRFAVATLVLLNAVFFVWRCTRVGYATSR